MFGEPIREFSRNLEALRDFVQVVAVTLDKQRTEEMKKDPDSYLPLLVAMGKLSDSITSKEKLKGLEEQMLKTFGSDVELTEDKIEPQSETKGFRVTTHRSATKRVEGALTSILKDSQRRARLYESSLINLISAVEWFVAKILHEYFKKFPGAIRSDYRFTITDLAAFNSITDARDYLVERAIENVLRDSLENWIKSLREYQKLSMSYIDAHVPQLKEAALRRNVLVHNGGVINSIYLNSVAPELKEKGMKVGGRVGVDPGYLTNMISLFEYCFILVAAEAWKKYEPDDKTRGDLLNELAFEHIKSERYNISEALCRFAMQDGKHHEMGRLNAKYNYWQSIKWAGRFSEVKQDVENEDCSARERKYVLAKQVLLDDFKAAAKTAALILKSGELTRAELEEWPIFRDFRKSPEYVSLGTERAKGKRKTRAAKVSKGKT